MSGESQAHGRLRPRSSQSSSGSSQSSAGSSQSSAGPPPLNPLPRRAVEIVDAARVVLETEGRDALTMRRLAEVMGIRAPSIYKHLPGKQAVEAALIDRALLEMGRACHDAIRGPAPAAALFATYRREALARPNLYRLATSGPLARELLTPGLEDWAGEPWFLVAGEPYLAQAMWAFAHGMVILELDGRFPETAHLDRTWAAAARAFG